MRKIILESFYLIIIISFVISCKSKKSIGNNQSLDQEQEEKDETRSSSTFSDNTDSTTTTSKTTTIPQTLSFENRGVPFTESEKSSIDNFKNKIEKFYDDIFEEEKAKAKAKKDINDLINKIKQDSKKIDSIDSYFKSTLLMYAAEQGNEKMINLLLKKNPDINKANESGMTALHYAILSENSGILELLLNRGADTKVNYHDNLQNSEKNLMDFAFEKIYNFSEKLKGKGGEIFKLLIEKGKFDANSKFRRFSDKREVPLISRAVEKKDIEFVKYLIDQRHVDVNTQDSAGNTLIVLAAQSGNVDILKFLVQREANLIIKDRRGPLLAAAQTEKEEALKFLIQQNLANEDINSAIRLLSSPEKEFIRNIFKISPEKARKMLDIIKKD
ncbi:MAG: ankyrin repeat domain-containing protein [Bacteroidetes bacterium]|nr:ankyrin repeat domain-containing protein [Bacteroidota bacterium]